MDVPQYVNTEWPFPTNLKSAKLWNHSSTIVSVAVYAFSRFWTRCANTTRVYYKERLLDYLEKDQKSRGPIITMSNHRSCLDDPLVWGAVLNWKHMFNKQFRWVPSAAELCFTQHTLSSFFGKGQCVPVERGKGVYQRGMDFCVERLNDKQWVHMFPEGKVNMEDNKRLKWGIGRLVADCEVIPNILPLWLIDFEQILPNKAPYIPRIGKKVAVVIGSPLPVADRVAELKSKIRDPKELRKTITDLIEKEFWKHKDYAEKLYYGDVR